MSTRQEYVDNIKSTFVTTGRSFTLGWLAANVPFTQFPIIKQIISGIVGKIWGEAADAAEFQVFILFIDTRVGKQGEDFEAAALRNAVAQKSGSDEQKKLAEAELKAVARSLISLKL